MLPQYLSTVPPSPIPSGTSPITVCYESNNKATFPVTVVITWHGSGKTATLTFDRDSCQPVDVEPGSYGAIAEDQSGQSLDLGIVFGH